MSRITANKTNIIYPELSYQVMENVSLFDTFVIIRIIRIKRKKNA
jgi:hypothetical protein